MFLFHTDSDICFISVWRRDEGFDQEYWNKSSHGIIAVSPFLDQNFTAK